VHCELSTLILLSLLLLVCMSHNRYPIGSNTKLFTAVAAWQLHRAGKLSVYEPAAEYMTNAAELGLAGPWCPRLHGAPETGVNSISHWQLQLYVSYNARDMWVWCCSRSCLCQLICTSAVAADT
jgi:hypothetical protein